MFSLHKRIKGYFRAKQRITDKLLSKIDGVELAGIDYRDYPDFVDAYITSAYWSDTDTDLTDDQLDQLNQNYSDYVYDRVIDHIY